MKFLNNRLRTNFKEEEIERYETNYITQMLQNRAADIVYKVKNKDIFILIEHQTKIDYSMPHRIAEYQINIINSVLNKKKIHNKSYEFPIVLPVVIYTGKKKWDADRYIEEQLRGTDIKIQLGHYEFIENNQISREELIEENTFIDEMLLIEKADSTEEMVENLEKITEIVNDKDKEDLENIISIIFEEKIGKEKSKELIKKINKGGMQMSAVIEMIRRERAMDFNEGIKEGKIEVAKELLKYNIPYNVDTIKKGYPILCA